MKSATKKLFMVMLLLLTAYSQAATRSIEHAMGVTQVPEHPKRVVVLTNEGTEALLSLGVKPVGAVRSWSGSPWYKHIEAEMVGVQVVGVENNVNLEMIAGLKPDLIIGTKFRQAKIYPILSSIAPTVLSSTLRGQWQSNFSLYANTLNKQSEGEALLASYYQRIAVLKAQLGERSKQQISVIRFMPSQVRIYQKDSFSGRLLSQLGFARPPIQDVDEFAIKNVGKERISDFEGDVLLYFTFNNDSRNGQKIVKEWMNEPLWQGLDVVKRGQLYEISDVLWNNSGGILAANLALNDIPRIFDIKNESSH